MEKEIFDYFEQQFGKEWVCTCGASFDSASVEVVSKTASSLLGKYICKNCSREQMLAVSSEYEFSLNDTTLKEVPTSSIKTDDVLDIKKEVSKISFAQIKNLAKKKATDKVFINKTNQTTKE